MQLPKLIFHSDLRRRAASRLALPCPSSLKLVSVHSVGMSTIRFFCAFARKLSFFYSYCLFVFHGSIVHVLSTILPNTIGRNKRDSVVCRVVVLGVAVGQSSWSTRLQQGRRSDADISVQASVSSSRRRVVSARSRETAGRRVQAARRTSRP